MRMASFDGTKSGGARPRIRSTASNAYRRMGACQLGVIATQLWFQPTDSQVWSACCIPRFVPGIILYRTV